MDWFGVSGSTLVHVRWRNRRGVGLARRRIERQTQTHPVVTSVRFQVRVPASHLWLLALFCGRQLLPKLPILCVCLQKAMLIGLQRGHTGRQAPGHLVATSRSPSARWPAPHLVHLAARRRACPFHELRHFSSTLPRRERARTGRHQLAPWQPRLDPR